MVCVCRESIEELHRQLRRHVDDSSNIFDLFDFVESQGVCVTCFITVSISIIEVLTKDLAGTTQVPVLGPRDRYSLRLVPVLT